MSIKIDKKGNRYYSFEKVKKSSKKKVVLTYSEYLKSKHWKNMKDKVPCNSCFVCGSKNDMNLHHKSYGRLGREKLRDLEWLCRNCHAKVHEIANNGTRLKIAHLELKELWDNGLLDKEEEDIEMIRANCV